MDRPHLRISVVDDDESVRKALGRLLRAERMDARTFASGQEFLCSLESVRPDCVILDVHMPGINGLDVQRRLAEGGLQLPVVVITGYDEPLTRARCMSAGAAAYLRKPLEAKGLLSAIYRAVDLQHSRVLPERNSPTP
jgi:FixJ family two-component response regulator